MKRRRSLIKRTALYNVIKQNENFPRLFVWSFFYFVFAALLLRFLYILTTATLLERFSIKYLFHFLNITYDTMAPGNWTEAKILFVYGIGTLIFTVVGWVTLFFLQKHKIKNLKFRLFLTWMAFTFVHLLPFGVVSGTFNYDEFGIAYVWLFNNMAARIAISTVTLAICIIMRPYWIRVFLRTAFSSEIIKNPIARTNYIAVALEMPVKAGTLVLLLFAFSVNSLTWIIYFGGLLLVALPIINPVFPLDKPLLIKTEDNYDLSPLVFLSMTTLLFALLVVSFTW
jgi:hypothetical protein